jgi:predicted ATPase
MGRNKHNCPNCGFKNPEGFNYCGKCGAVLIRPSDNLTSLVASRIPDAVRQKILLLKNSNEQRPVYVVHAKISSAHPADAQLGKDVSIPDRRLYELIVDTVYKYEGIISSIHTSEITMQFGAAIAHEDDAERAVSCALDITTVIEKYNEECNCSIMFSIGIHTGHIIVKDVGPDLMVQYRALGNIIRRVKQLAKNALGKIIVSKEINRRINHIYEMDEWRTRKTSSPLYIVKGLKEIPGRKHGLVEFRTPLIGRAKEIDLMNTGYETLLNQKSIVITVIGEAGIGKSRLIEEFRNITKNKVNWLSGRCLSYGHTFPFWVFLEQIRSYLGVRDFDIDVESSRKLDGKAEQLFEERADEYLPYLCVFLSIKVLEHLQDKIRYLDPESLRLQEFISVQAFFREIVSAKPLVLYFEDMQWVDPESLDLLRYLLEGLSDVPICFLFETRPDKDVGVYTFKDAVQRLYLDRYIEIELNPLTTGDIKSLVSNLLDITPSHAFWSLILDKSEGNPFFVEEIIRSLIDSGIITRDGKKWHCAEEISSIELPDSVDALIRARIDRLSSNQQHVIACAAIIGKQFHYRLLSAVCSEFDTDENLEVLEEKAFIYRFSNHALKSSEVEYSFRHGLLRDVVIKVLPEKTRKQLHKRVARCIEELFKERIEEYFEILAYHYLHADVQKKAYDFFVKAGDRAKSLYNNDSAIELYTKAIQIHEGLLPKNENLAELFEKRGDTREIKAEYDEAVQDYQYAFKILQNRERKADLQRKIGRVHRQKDEYKNARRYYQKAIGLLRNKQASPVYLHTMLEYAFIKRTLEGDHKEAQRLVQFVLEHLDKEKYGNIYALGLLTLGFVIQFTGNYTEVLKYYREALVLYEKNNEKRGIGIACNNLGLIFVIKGEFNTALEYYKRYLAITQEIGDKREQMTACNHIGRIYRMRGEYDTALRYYQKHFAIAQEIGQVKNMGLAYLTNGYIYYAMGDYETAVDYFETYQTISKDINDEAGVGIAHQRLALVYAATREFKKVKYHIEQAIEIFTTLNAATKTSEAYIILVEAHIVQEQLDKALGAAKKALYLALKEQVAIQYVIALRTLGKVEALFDPFMTGNLEKSLELARIHGMNLEVAQCLYELAEACKRTKAFVRAQDYAQQALLIYNQAGAGPDVEKTKTIIRSLDHALVKT